MTNAVLRQELPALRGEMADLLPLSGLMLFWLPAGVGQNGVNLLTETLLAECTEEAAQGRMYGAHFAWSHLWWAFAYPLAGFLGTYLANRAFFLGGGLALLVLAGVWFTYRATVQRAAARVAPRSG